MAHLVRAQPDAVWKRGYITLGVDLRAIDRNTFVAVNGDEGGTWTMAADLVIGGAGMICAAAWTIGGTLGFGVNSVIDTNGTTAQITFGRGTADDVFGYPSPLTYTLTSPILEHFAVYNEQAKAILTYPSGPFGVRTLALGARFVVPLRVFNGGRATSFTLNWTVGEAHASVPTRMPSMRVYAVDASGNILPLRASDGTATDANGFQQISTATTGGGYNAANANQTFVYTCNQNQTIDIATYSYFAEIIDESGTNAWATTGNTYSSAIGVFDSVLGYDGRN